MKFFGNIWSDYYFKALETELSDCDSVLDLACGRNSPLRFTNNKQYRVGVDIFEPYLKESKDIGIHDDYIVSDIMKLDKNLSGKKFDAVIGLDIIEHLTKEEGFNLVKIMSNIASKKVILFTPNGFVKQDEFDNNPWQKHKSGWSFEEMTKLGFRVYGMGGHKYLRGQRAIVKFWPKFVWSIVSYNTQRFVISNPQKAYQLLCIKYIN